MKENKDIIITPLKRIEVQGGDVLHSIKDCDQGFYGFEEAYFSWINPEAIKAWKKHNKMTLNLIVPVGEVKFVFYYPELGNKFHEEIIGENNYKRITVPPEIWFGFKGESESTSLVLNIANIKHDPDEVLNEPISRFNYEW